MPSTQRPRSSRLWPTPAPAVGWSIVLGLMVAAAPAGAADGHGPTKAAAPAQAGRAGDLKVDPMDALREKLAQKLGATQAPEAPTPYVVRVSSKSGEDAPAEPKPARAPSKKPRAKSAGLVAKLEAEKGGAMGLAHPAHPAHWGYGGAEGPAQWGMLKPEFSTCSTGTRQSPIDIRGGVKVDLEPIEFDYRPSAFGVIDNGHTVQVNVQGGNAIEVMGRRYDLVHFHFHRPSEERINGRQYDMSVHLVHRDPEGRLAVVAVLLDRGSAHPVVQTVWNNLPLEKKAELQAQVALDPNNLLPPDRRYFTYMGSLTTPPCSEGVLWMVMQQQVPVSNEQISVFSRLYPMNARPVQAAAGRLIKGSN